MKSNAMTSKGSKISIMLACALASSLAHSTINEPKANNKIPPPLQEKQMTKLAQLSNDGQSNSSHSPHNAQKDAQNPQAIELQKVTTTANKYEAEVSSVNSSVQVVKEQQLQNANIKSTTELSSAFAGLQIQDADGSSVFPMAVLRGVSSADYYSTTLNLYVDGVPQSPNFLIQALGDVEQVELLRGAQGTLYGENSQSGLISIRTKNPIKGNYANISLTGSKLYEDLNAYIGGELVKNKLWGKASVRYTHENGFVKYGNRWRKTSDTILGGVSLYYAPVSAFLATLSYNFNYMPNNTKGFYITKSQFENNAKSWGGYEVPSSDVFPNIYAANPWHKSLSHSASLKLDYDFSGHLLSFVSAFQKSDSLLNTYPMVQTYGGKKDGYFYDVTQFIEELRLSSEYGNGVRTTFGAYYKHLLTDNGMRGFIPNNGGDTTAFGLRANWNAKETINTAALFADALFPLGAHFDIGIGARYQWLRSDMDAPVSPGAGITAPYKNHKDWHSFDPRISFGFIINDNARIYLSASHATKQGGFAKFPYADSDQRPYNPEQIYSAEVGSHLKFLDSKFRANIAAYYMYIIDRQSYVGNSLQQSIKNIGDAYSTGLEADINYYGERVSAGLGLNVGHAQYTNSSKNTGFLDFTSTENNGGNGGGQGPTQISVPYDVRGKALKFSPLVSLTANVDWNFLKKGEHRFYLGGNLRFYTRQYFEDLARSADLSQKAYAVLDLYTRYEWKHLSLKIFAQNATNTRYALYSRAVNSMGPYYMVGNPWNLGAQVEYKY